MAVNGRCVRRYRQDVRPISTDLLTTSGCVLSNDLIASHHGSLVVDVDWAVGGSAHGGPELRTWSDWKTGFGT